VGLFLDRLMFPGTAPSREELEAHLREQIGGIRGLEGYDVEEGGRAELRCMLDPVTRPYALAFLLGRGGTRLSIGSDEPIATELPRYVERPLREHSWWFRWKLFWGFNLGLLGTAWPRPRKP
jgi:hypothetical protein